MIDIETFMSKRKYSKTHYKGDIIVPDIRIIGSGSSLRPIMQNNWQNLNEDTKAIIGVLNKINESNYDKLSRELIDLKAGKSLLGPIFNKIGKEKTYIGIYKTLIIDLINDNQIMSNDIISRFVESVKNNNIIHILCELYNDNIISDEDIATISKNFLNDCETNNENIEYLMIILKLTNSISIYADIIKGLKNIKCNNSRIRFQLNDFLRELK